MKHRVITKKFSDGRTFSEDFYLDFSSGDPAGLFGLFGIGKAVWSGHYRNCTAMYTYHISLELITGGAFRLTDHRSGERIVKSGDLVLLGLKNPWCMEASPEGTKQCIFFVRSPVMIALINDLFRDDSVIHVADWQNLQRCFEAVYQSASLDGPDPEAAVYPLLRCLKRVCRQRKYPPKFESLLRKMEEDLQQDCSVCRFAEWAGVSISTLNRWFQSHLHCSPGEYRMKCRMEMALRLLASHHMSVKEVAAECGFSSSAFFCREFKKKTGRTPGSFMN